MQKVKVIVARKDKVVRNGAALILNTAENFEVVGREGADILDYAVQLQPDLLIYELCSTDDSEYELLKKLRELCAWTKIVIFTEHSIKKEIQHKLWTVCDGYLQEPIIPGFLLKAVELVCYSGYFFYLGAMGNMVMEKEEQTPSIPLIKLINKNSGEH